MKKLFLLITCCFAINAYAQKINYEGKWQQLFNGKDLTGWDIKIKGHELNENYGNTFRSE